MVERLGWKTPQVAKNTCSEQGNDERDEKRNKDMEGRNERKIKGEKTRGPGEEQREKAAHLI